MRNLNIRNKILVSFGITFVLTLAIGLIGIFSLVSASNNTVDLNNRSNNSSILTYLLANMNAQQAAYRGASLYYLIEDEERLARDTGSLETLDAEFDATLSMMNTDVLSATDSQAIATISTAYASYDQQRVNFLDALSQPGLSEADVQALISAFSEPAAAVVSEVTTLVSSYANDTDRSALDSIAAEKVMIIFLIVILVLAVAGSILISNFLTKMIVPPLHLIQVCLKQIADTGNLNFTEEEWAMGRKYNQYKDEASQALAAFMTMLKQMLYYGQVLEKISKRDLTVQIDTLGPQDTMGNGLSTMVNTLSDMINEIKTSAEFVSAGAVQIADGATALANGSTDQAATLDQLSSSIGQIREKSILSSKMAVETTGYTTEAANFLGESIGYMGQLNDAMTNIENSSKNIVSVTKVIEDIAFQTNILALNAAVEAARAGQHGKGFAVVADEVRNLAAKSSAAAKETSSLIQGSVDSVRNGSGILVQTGDSLTKVTEIAGRIVVAMEDISAKNEEQYAAIDEMTTAISQVSMVVQANSATAQESAASSEELSSQSAVLNDIIAKFKTSQDHAAVSSGRSGYIAATSESNYDFDGGSNNDLHKYSY